MVSRLVKAAVIAAVLALVIDSLPEIRRYLEIREMLDPHAGEDVRGVETVIGFVVGYLVGTRQGRQGMQNALESAQAIWASPETKRLLGEGLSAVETVAGQAMERFGANGSKSRRAALISSVMDELIERRQARRAA